MDEGERISIGRFAHLTGISANTLRRYDAMGILSPAFTDPSTRYRFYTIEQLDTGILVRLLRDLDVPLEQIASQLGDGDPQRFAELLVRHRERIAERLAELDRILRRIDAAVDDGLGLAPFRIEITEADPLWVVSRRISVMRADLDDELERLLGVLDEELAAAGHAAIGRELVLYHNALFWYQGLDMEVCLPVEPAVAAAHGGRELPGGLCVRALYRGPWDDIWQAYAAMLAVITRRGYVVTGPARESYLVDERDTDDPERYLTDITWPVREREPDADSSAF